MWDKFNSNFSQCWSRMCDLVFISVMDPHNFKFFFISLSEISSSRQKTNRLQLVVFLYNIPVNTFLLPGEKSTKHQGRRNRPFLAFPPLAPTNFSLLPLLVLLLFLVDLLLVALLLLVILLLLDLFLLLYILLLVVFVVVVLLLLLLVLVLVILFLL